MFFLLDDFCSEVIAKAPFHKHRQRSSFTRWAFSEQVKQLNNQIRLSFLMPYVYTHIFITKLHFSNVNKNTMISGLWMPLKALLAHKIWDTLLKPRGSSRSCPCTSLLVPVAENIPSEIPILSPLASRALPARCRGRWALLVPATTSRPPCHWLCRRSPGLCFPLPLTCSEVRSRGVPAHSSLFPISRDSSYIKR